MTRYTSVTDADLSAMLATIGVDSVDELFADIPAGLRMNRPLSLGPGLSEQEVYEELRALAARSTSAEDEVSFLGAGMYDHYTPALIDSIILRSEFLTPYTPYQPEISQGGLQAMFEYQTALRSGSSPSPRRSCAACPGASPARPRTSTASAVSCSPFRPASSTSDARRRPPTSARRRRSTRSPA
jgi:hypothetical protein